MPIFTKIAQHEHDRYLLTVIPSTNPLDPSLLLPNDEPMVNLGFWVQCVSNEETYYFIVFHFIDVQEPITHKTRCHASYPSALHAYM